jgi:hypothetical protein
MVRVFQKDSCDGSMLSKSGEARLDILDARIASLAQTQRQASLPGAENVSLQICQNPVTLGWPGITMDMVLARKQI